MIEGLLKEIKELSASLDNPTQPVKPGKDYNSELSNAIRALCQKASRERAMRRRLGPQTKTRSTFAWRAANTGVTRTQLMSLAGYADYVPPGQSGQVDRVPILSVRVREKFILFRKNVQTGELEFFRHDFTRCCSGNDSDPQYCNKNKCVNCYTAVNRAPAGYEWYISVGGVDWTNVKVVDPAGVDPHGRRSREAVRTIADEDVQDYRLTSTLYNYRSSRQKQHAPAEYRRKRKRKRKRKVRR